MRQSMLSAALCAALLGLTVAAMPACAQDQAKPAQPQGFPDLVAGLKAEPGCLGVETARTDSGKQVIFAWFKDKAAAMHWYGSQMHQDVMNKFLPSTNRREPMSLIKDNSGPIMVIASITPNEKAKVGQMPISQIAIELYA